MAFPLILLIAGTAAAFGPILGFTYAAARSLASALLTYFLGVWLGRDTLESVLGPRLNRIRARIERSGTIAVAAIRLVPIAPFTIVNMVLWRRRWLQAASRRRPTRSAFIARSQPWTSPPRYLRCVTRS